MLFWGEEERRRERCNSEETVSTVAVASINAVCDDEIDGSGTEVVSYTYDAWGNLRGMTGSLASTVGTYNPIRYRGYVYDTETGFYYLNDRYYNPEWGRFINADIYVSTGQGMTGANMFAYCGNDPVNRLDPTGKDYFLYASGDDTPWDDMILQNLGRGGSGGTGGLYSTTTAGRLVGKSSLEEIAAGTVAVGVTLAITTTKEERIKDTYSVYFLKDDQGVIRYVGRVKDKGYEARMTYHLKTRGLTPACRISGLNYLQARGLEELGMVLFHTINRFNPKNNKIHGIALFNRNRAKYFDAAYEYLDNKLENLYLAVFGDY